MRRLALALAMLLLATTAHAQEAPLVIAEGGTEVFGHIMHHYGKLQPVLDPTAGLDAHKTVLIDFGKLDRRLVANKGRPLHAVHQFLVRGGNVLLAGDLDVERTLPARTPSILEPWGLALDKPIKVLPHEGYQGLQDCPRIEQHTLPLLHPLFLGVQRDLATNCPRSLKLKGPLPLPDLEVLARLSQFSASLAQQTRDLDDGWRWLAEQFGRALDPIYMVGSPASAPPQGRLLILGGHGIFTNCMLVQADCDNFTFAVNCIRWLREGPQGPRTHALFRVDGEIVGRFDLPLVAPPPPIPMPTAALLDRLAADLEDEGFFQELLKEDQDLANSLVQGLLITITVLLLLYGAHHLLAGRYHAETSVPLLVGPAAPAKQRRRHEELLTRDNLWEEAQALARAWFHEHCALAPTHWYGEQQTAELAFAVVGSFWRRWRLQRQLQSVWELACPGPLGRVSKRRFVALGRNLADLSRAVQAGELLIEVHE
jgi:hypothetical protein